MTYEEALQVSLPIGLTIGEASSDELFDEFERCKFALCEMGKLDMASLSPAECDELSARLEKELRIAKAFDVLLNLHL